MAFTPEDETLVEDYLDCAGRKRVFRLGIYAEGRFLEAVELRGGEATGLRFVMEVNPGEIPPWGEMRDKIRERLSQRDIVRDAHGNLHELHRVIRAQITDRDQLDRGTPVLLVDDMEVTWEELGRLLMPYTGWGLRIDGKDAPDVRMLVR